MKKQILLIALIVVVLFSCKKEDTNTDLIKDGSGNVYTEIQIGDQIWLKEDLATHKYNDGTIISSDKYQDKGIEGLYYSDFSDFRKICPKGYRVPTKYDYEKLISHFGGGEIDNKQVYDSYVSGWNGNPNGNGDGILNQGSGLYWTSSEGLKYGHYHFYFRTKTEGIIFKKENASVDNYTVNSFFHIKCIK